jgi:hypothetical protein
MAKVMIYSQYFGNMLGTPLLLQARRWALMFCLFIGDTTGGLSSTMTIISRIMGIVHGFWALACKYPTCEGEMDFNDGTFE